MRQHGYKSNPNPPELNQLGQVPPWDGWSIQRFWQDVQAKPVTRIQMQTASPNYSGQVYVLIGPNTASAAELAADALSQLSNVTIVGETSAGEMLSQSIFDLPYQLHLFIPVADYYSATNGRIEGHGVKPDIQVPADKAFDYVLKNLIK